jgi:MraZ protein
VFIGHSTNSVDQKGRVSLPARLRKHIAPEANDTLVMTRGTTPCIWVYPLDEWTKILVRLKTLNIFKPDDELFIKMFLLFAQDDTLDSQSRILIPQPLLAHAKIEKEVLIIGALDRIEFWNPSEWDNYLLGAGKSYKEVTEHVMGG